MSGYRVLLAVLSALLLLPSGNAVASETAVQPFDLRVDNVVNPCPPAPRRR